MKNISTEKIVFLVIGGLTVFALILIVIFSLNEQKQAKGVAAIASSHFSMIN